ncbi:hypothetical protein [Pedobacter cryoconitis]|uniref:Uncharacterized protein n=1 Tax=Pedobacter cryoconitis TaxID=188932 RepID=A0A327RXG7_9SPHI|nr:hypothetical protein [Pedobacter cryoconitis]RAJ21155.1 hypothetical protein LY11_04996 [Pedobacter cryoconitis]
MNIKPYPLIILLTTLLTTTLSAQTKNIGLIYPLSSNGKHAPLDSNTFSLNLIAGVSAAEDGFTIAGVTNLIHHTSKGVQIAGFSNHIGQKATGLRIAGFMNLSEESKGTSVAGFLNKSTNMEGLQVAGFGNFAHDVKNIQIAGFMNKAKNTSSQIAGFMNIAKKVKGVQIAAFLNIADSSDYPIGFINIIKNGEKSLAITTDDNLTTLLTFRSGGRILYGILGIGYNLKNKKEIYAAEAGLGAHVYTSQAFRLNLELSGLTLKDFKAGEYFKSSIKILPAFKISPHLEIFGGPTFNYVNTNTEEGRNLTEKFISKWESKNGNKIQGIYAGYTAGVQYIF